MTSDDKFVTKRHSIQAIWRIGLGGSEQQEFIINKLYDRFESCKEERHHTLIRYDIIVGLHQLFEHTGDSSIQKKSEELIEMEIDLKYKKKYAKVLGGNITFP